MRKLEAAHCILLMCRAHGNLTEEDRFAFCKPAFPQESELGKLALAFDLLFF